MAPVTRYGFPSSVNYGSIRPLPPGRSRVTPCHRYICARLIHKDQSLLVQGRDDRAKGRPLGFIAFTGHGGLFYGGAPDSLTVG